MKNEKIKSILLCIPFLIVMFGGLYLYRQGVSSDIKNHSKYAFGVITKKTGSLNSGVQWHYEFRFKEKIFTGMRSTHVDYEVNEGDLFLVNFSSKNPEHNKILYEYKLKIDKVYVEDSVWDTIPITIVRSGLKK